MRLPFSGSIAADELTQAAQARIAQFGRHRLSQPAADASVQSGPDDHHGGSPDELVGGWVPHVPAAALGAPWRAETPPPAGESERAERQTSERPESRRSGAGAAAADRLPLPLRALWERWAPGLAGLRVEMGRGQIVVVVVALAIGVGIAAVVYGLSRPQVVPVGAEVVATGTPVSGDDVSSDGAPATAGPAAPGATSAVLVVHVAGKVADPGVVSLPAGSRVVDAIDAAGGATDGVDLTPLNLARVLTDGEQVLVGVDPPPGHDPPGGAGTASDGSGTGPVDLNSAGVEQLETLPGIGPTLAQRILDWRTQHGRFTAVDELNEVSGIGPAKFAEIAPLVTV